MNNANGGNIIYRFLGDTSNLDQATKKASGGFKGMTKSMLVANLATKAVSAGMKMIAQNSERAIQRIDTFRAFPKVMKNFGVSNEEASASIDRMDKAMRGLPTSLDQAVSGVQNLFMVTKDLPEAERMFMAINDSAMIFANGSTEAVERFSYAYKQAMASGKVYAQDFNQMNEAIPGVLDKVADLMGISFRELKEGLSEGNISMDEFNKALKKLDTEGGAGMKAMAETAKTSTGGIATAITNAKTAVTRGVASMYESIDKGLKEAGLGGIVEVVSNMGKAMETAMKKVAPYITQFIIKIRDVYDWVKKNQTLVKALAIAIISLAGAFKVLLIISEISTLLTTIAPTISMITGFVRFAIGVVQGLMVVLKALWVVMMANPIFLVIAGIVAIIAGLVLLYKKCEWFRNLVNGIFTWIVNFFKNNWQTLLMFLVNPFAAAFKLLYNNCEGFRNFVNKFVNTVVGFFKSIPGKVKAVAHAILNAFLWLPNQMLNVGRNIAQGLWNGIQGLRNWVINKVKALGKSILNSIKSVLGIHSPSTEFAMVGRFSVLGYTEALDKMQNDIQDKVKETFGLSPQLTGSMNTHYSPNVNVINNVDVSTDPLGQTVKKIKTFSGGAKNDYNYGMGV